MGCFDYECNCGGVICGFKGGQNGGSSNVAIEVPLSDGTTIVVAGKYDSYGSVAVGKYTFYPEQFGDFIEGWLENEKDEARSSIFLAGKIWTTECISFEDNAHGYMELSDCYQGSTTELTDDIVARCIRADKDFNIPSDDDKKNAKIQKLKEQIRKANEDLDRISKP